MGILRLPWPPPTPQRQALRSARPSGRLGPHKSLNLRLPRAPRPAESARYLVPGLRETCPNPLGPPPPPRDGQTARGEEPGTRQPAPRASEGASVPEGVPWRRRHGRALSQASGVSLRTRRAPGGGRDWAAPPETFSSVAIPAARLQRALTPAALRQADARVPSFAVPPPAGLPPTARHRGGGGGVPVGEDGRSAPGGRAPRQRGGSSPRKGRKAPGRPGSGPAA